MIRVVWLATYTMAVSFAYAIVVLVFPEYGAELLFLVVPAIIIPEAFCEIRGYVKRARVRAQERSSRQEISQ